MKKSHFILLIKQLWKNKLITFVSIFGIAFTVFFSSIIFVLVDSKYAPNEPATKKYRSVYGNEYNVIRDKNGKTIRLFFPSYHFWYKYICNNKTIENYSIHSREYVNDYSNDKLTHITLEYCDHQFWKVYDFKFIEGRPFVENEMRKGQQLLVISEAKKKELFSSSETAIGKTVLLDNKNYKIIGVVKDYNEWQIDYFLPVPLDILDSKELESRENSYSMVATARNKRQVQLIITQLKRKFDADMENITGNSEHSINHFLLDFKEREAMVDILLFLLVVLALFLLLPILNLAYLNKYRITGRITEIGLRKSFGATHGNIRKQFFVEVLTITFIGGIVGIFLAIIFKPIIIELINAIFGVSYKPEAMPFHWQYIFYLLFLVFVVGLLSGFFPINRFSKSNIAASVQSDNASGLLQPGKRKKRGWGFLIVQFTLSFILLFTATTFFVKYINRLHNSIGWGIKDVVNIMTWTTNSEEENKKVEENWPRVESYLQQNPKVSDFGKYAGFGLLLSPGKMESVITDERESKTSVMIVDYKFPEIMKLKLKSGRWFKEGEQHEKVPPVVINSQLATQLFPDTYPINKILTFKDKQYYVAGVCKKFYFHDLHNSLDPYGVLIMPMVKSLREIGKDLSYVVKYKDNVSDKIVSETYSDIVKLCGTNQFTSFRVASMDEMLDNNWEEAFMAIIILLSVTVFLMLNLMLSLMSIIQLTIRSRLTEISIRRALGATKQRVYKLIIGEMFFKAIIACAIAFVIIFQGFIFDIFKVEDWIYILSLIISVTLLFSLIGMFAIWPAMEATRVEPVKALHEN